MTPSRNNLRQRDNGNDSLGLTAIGSAGRWEVAIDETTSGTQRWFAQIEGPSIYLYFEVPSPHVIETILDFLTEHTTAEKGSQDSPARRNGEIVIGKRAKEPVTLVRDDEFSDRYFLVAETETKLVVRVTIGGADLKSLVSALRQANEDLNGNDSD
jgi:hypothetical protein